MHLVFATRKPEQYKLDLKHFIQFGASPRATIYLTLAAKAWALLQGRDLRHARRRQEHRPGCAAPSHHPDLRSRGAGGDDDAIIKKIFNAVPCREGKSEGRNPKSKKAEIRMSEQQRPLAPAPLSDFGFRYSDFLRFRFRVSGFALPHDITEFWIVRASRCAPTAWSTTRWSGAYLSHFKGRGMDFEELREYIPGDEVRDIDWNVTYRMGRPFVKRYREERELAMVLAVDISGSSAFGSLRRTKREFAAEIAGTLAISATRSSDKVALLLFTDQVELFLPPRKGRRHILRLIREMLFFRAEASRHQHPGGAGVSESRAAPALDRFPAHGFSAQLRRGVIRGAWRARYPPGNRPDQRAPRPGVRASA